MHALLGSRRTYHLLLFLNLLVALAVMWAFRTDRGNDFRSYMGLAEGILHGTYSMWWMMDPPIPDTFRTPGYPLYLALVLKLFTDWKALKLIQAVLYVGAIHLSLRLIDRFDRQLSARNIFLLLLLPSINIPMYIGIVSPEVPVMAAIALLLVYDPVWQRPGWGAAVAIGLLYGFIFQCRPVFLLLPIARVAIDHFIFRDRAALARSVVMLATFLASLVPYGIWNNRHHGQFSVTPLEGGGGVFHLGYWSGLIPGHQEMHYWANIVGDEMLLFVPRASVPENVAAFEKEWALVGSTLQPLLTAQDSAMLARIATGEQNAIQTYNVRYTRARERMLKDLALAHIRERPWYYIRFKAYSLVRLWVVGIPHTEFQQAGALTKAKMIFQFGLTLAFFLAALVAIPWALVRGLLSFRKTYPLLLWVVYCTFIHLPFTIQTRYTVPVRLAFYVLLALALAALLRPRVADNGPKA
jgi:hypothetical protein